VRSKLLAENGGRTWALVFDKGDEVVETLTAFAVEQRLSAAHFTAIGAFSEALLGYFDRGRKAYLEIPVPEQVEVLSVVGDVAEEQDKPRVHAHVVVGTITGETRGGHLLSARVWPTLELILTETPAHLRKRSDPETGLALIAPEL
jgi:predicted DNA-binding protein with PD1-like motif